MVGMSTLTLTHIPSQIDALVKVPLSKSICNRSLILSKVLGSDIANVPLSSANDSQLLFRILSEFPKQQVIDVEDAGTVSRFMTALCAAQSGQTFILRGTERMHERPIKHLVDALIQLGADITYLEQEGCLPLRIEGQKLKGCNVDLSGASSSQFASALLLISPLIEGELLLDLGNKQVSKPYLEMTLDILSKQGATIQTDDHKIQISKDKTLRAIDFGNEQESDWSAAIYPLLINTLNPNYTTTVYNLKLRSKQGDSRITGFTKQLGFDLQETAEGVRLNGVLRSPNSLELDMTNTPDLAQPFACYCASQKIPFLLTGLDTLQKKETKRIDALVSEFGKLGIETAFTSSSLKVSGYPATFHQKAVFKSYDDHRMAMSLFFFMTAEPSCVLKGYESVKKSFPDYWNMLSEMGFRFDIR